jgi:hypothetical protein
MDESLFMYCEEMDWCMRLRAAGWEVWVNPDSQIVHLGGRSSAQIKGASARHLRDSKARYFAKHHGRCAGGVLRGLLALRSAAKRLSAWKVR